MTHIALPVLIDGIIDWDTVFNDPAEGLVVRIEQARSGNDLKHGVQLILETLFSRDGEGDSSRRTVFTNLVNDILTQAKKTKPSPAAAFAEVKIRIIQILHRLREDRKTRARKALITKARMVQLSDDKTKIKLKESPGREARQPTDAVHITVPEASPVNEDGDKNLDTVIREMANEDKPADDQLKDNGINKASGEEAQDYVGDENRENNGTDHANNDNSGPAAEDYFAGVILASIMDSLATIQDQDLAPSEIAGKLPYILSPAFSILFEKVVRDHVIPDFVEGSYVTTGKMATQPRSNWRQFLSETFANQAQSMMLWERWQMAWLDATTEREEPPAPVIDPAKQGIRGVFTRLMGNEDYFIEEEEMTPEEWEEAVAETKEANIRAMKAWSLLTEKSDEYHAPSDDDNDILMALFRGVEDPENHITALMEFAGNNESSGRLFDSYADGKDMDLPLLIASYRDPDTMLLGDRTILSYFVGGISQQQRQTMLPLTCRYLGSFL